MNSHSKNLQEMIIHLCRQLREAFGADYCRIALSPETAKANGVVQETDSAAPAEEQDLTVITLDGNSNAYLALARPNGNETEKLSSWHADMVSSIAEACRKPKPILRFHLQPESDAGLRSDVFAFLDLSFGSPRQFSAVEIMAMMLMVEMSKTVLAAAWRRTVQATSAEQVVGKLQNNLFAMPFLEAKKQWIDAFEEEYLRQQLMKYYGNISKAARAARISRYTLYALLNKFQFSARSFKKSKISRSAAKASLQAAIAANGSPGAEAVNPGAATAQVA